MNEDGNDEVNPFFKGLLYAFLFTAMLLSLVAVLV